MIICADDFGMSETIDDAVLELVSQRKVTAVSCAVSHPACSAKSLTKLIQHGSTADVGLHLVLTDEGRPSATSAAHSLTADGKFHDFRTLLVRSYFHQLDPIDVKAEIASQYKRLESLAGRPPDFIDGHLHVHQFPIIRQVLLDFVCDLRPAQRPYLRNTHMRASNMLRTGTSLLKNLAIGSPGRTFRRYILRRGLPTNTGFAGIYNYGPRADFSQIFRKSLASVPSTNDILVVHPGLREAWRRREFDALWDWKPRAGRTNRFLREGISPEARFAKT